MATNLVEICSVCTDEYDNSHRQSVSLPCGHDFCLSCLVRLRAKGKHKCPRCRRNWAMIALPILSGMEALATALESDQDDEEDDVGNKKVTDDRCKKHSCPYDFWVNAKKEFYCRKCAAEDRSGVVLDVIEEAVPQIKAALAADVTQVKIRLESDLELLDEKHANLVQKRNSVRMFSKAMKALEDNFDQEIEQVAAQRTEALNSSVELEKVEEKIPNITSPADLGVAMECKNTLKRVGAPSSVSPSALLQTLLSNIACSYEGLEGLSADDDFLTRFSSELKKSSPNHEKEAQASGKGIACGGVSAKSISKTIPERTKLVDGEVLRQDIVRAGHLIDWVGSLRSSGPGGLLGHVRLFEGIGKVNNRNLCMGIDLGMANSCVAIVRNGRVDIISNDLGERITPSFVGFTDEEALVGSAAKAQATWNPMNTVYDVKRLIGRKYNDPSVQKIIKEFPFQTKESDLNLKIVVEFKGETKTFSPEEITAFILMKMKAIAENYVGMDIKDAVITVPAYFDDSQRQATMYAGVIAGLNVLNIINEPTAAAIAYGVEKKTTDRRNILVFHIGGGVQEVCVLAVENGNFQIMAVNADLHFGDSDLDDRLMTHFMVDFKREMKADISGNARAMAKLRKGCETVRQNLSSSIKERIEIGCLYQDVDFTSSITRDRFENLCSDLFARALAPVATVLGDAGLTKCDIDEVVLAGGSTRIPKIQQLLQECFQGKPLNKCINPDEVFAYGAALEAANLAWE